MEHDSISEAVNLDLYTVQGQSYRTALCYMINGFEMKFWRIFYFSYLSMYLFVNTSNMFTSCLKNG